MTKHVDFQWKVPVPEELLKGAVFDRWTEEKDDIDKEDNCLFRVDDCGFYIYWKSDGREGDVLDISQVSIIISLAMEDIPKKIEILFISQEF